MATEAEAPKDERAEEYEQEWGKLDEEEAEKDPEQKPETPPDPAPKVMGKLRGTSFNCHSRMPITV